MKKRIMSVLALVMAAALVFCGCAKKQSGTVTPGTEFLRVNGIEISEAEFKFYLEAMKVSYSGGDENFDWSQDAGDGSGRTAIEYLKEAVYSNITEIKAVAAEAEKYSITATDEDVESLRGQLLQYYGTEEDAIAKTGITAEGITAFARDFVLASNTVNYLIGDEAVAAVTDEEARAKYDSEVERLAEEEKNGYVRAKHILVMFETEDGTVRTDEEALALANEIKSQITDDNFEELMYEYSEDPGSFSNPDGYSFYHGGGDYVEEFDNGTYALEIGGVSEPVKTSYGYHIIKRLPLIDSFDDSAVKENMKSEVAYDKYEEIINSMKVEKNDEKYNAVN